jgi:hypothetical protein
VPKAGHSCEDTQLLEDDTARLLGAGDQLDQLRAFGLALRQRGKITDATYRDFRDACDILAAALLTGRRNTARLRRD